MPGNTSDRSFQDAADVLVEDPAITDRPDVSSAGAAEIQHGSEVAGRERRRSLGERIGPVGPLWAICVAAVTVAYWHSLRSLAVSFSFVEPRTYGLVVMVVATALATWCVIARQGGRSLQDREVDWIIGLSAVAAALFVLAVLPERMGVGFWVRRIDLLSLPLFASGVTVLVLGTRRFWNTRVAILFLFLAWPPIVRAAADITIAAAGRTTASVVLLTAIATGAVALVLRGPSSRRICWFVAAIVVAAVGQRAVSVVVHLLAPAASSALRSPAAVVIMAGTAIAAAAAIAPAVGLERPAPRTAGHSSGSRPRFGIVAVGVASILAASLAGSVTAFAGVTDSLGAPTATTLLQRHGSANGYDWQSLGMTEGTADRPPLERYSLRPVTGTDRRAVLVDVIPETASGNSAEADLRAALPLVRRRLLHSDTLDLGHGVMAERMTFGGVGETWTAVTWIVPVGGPSLAPYERVVVAVARPRSLTDQTLATGASPVQDPPGPPELTDGSRAVVRTEFGMGAP